jgi:siroheme synthase-like protein
VSRNSASASFFPLFLKLAGRKVVVAGAGAVAERKIRALVEAGARVTVVAPRATDAVRRLAAARRLAWKRRRFEEKDADGAWLVFAATADADVQRRVARAANARRVFVVAIDDPSNCTAISAAVVRRPPMTIAVSSSGAAPALTRLVRELLEHVLPGREWIERAQELREAWRADGTPADERFAELVRDVLGGARKRPPKLEAAPRARLPRRDGPQPRRR